MTHPYRTSPPQVWKTQRRLKVALRRFRRRSQVLLGRLTYGRLWLPRCEACGVKMSRLPMRMEICHPRDWPTRCLACTALTSKTRPTGYCPPRCSCSE